MMEFRSTGKTETTSVHGVKYFLRCTAFFPQPPLHCVPPYCLLNVLPSNGYRKLGEQNFSLFTGNRVKEKSRGPRIEPYNLLNLRTGRREREAAVQELDNSHATSWRRPEADGRKAEILQRGDHRRQ